MQQIPVDPDDTGFTLRFRPRDLGLERRWGFVFQAMTGTISIFAYPKSTTEDGDGIKIAEFADDQGDIAHMDELDPHIEYRATGDAGDVYVI